MPTSGGRPGTSTTAETCRKVFSTEELRYRLIDLCPQPYKLQFGEIIFDGNSSIFILICYHLIFSKPAAEAHFLFKTDQIGQTRFVNGIT